MKKNTITRYSGLISLFILASLLMAKMPLQAMKPEAQLQRPPVQQDDMSREGTALRCITPIAQCGEFACQRTLNAPVGAQVLGGAGLCYFGSCLAGYGCCMSCGAGCAGATLATASGMAKQQEGGGILPATAEFWIGPQDTDFYRKKIRQIFNAICGLVGVSPVDESPVPLQEHRQPHSASEDEKEDQQELKIVGEEQHAHSIQAAALEHAKRTIHTKAQELGQQNNAYLGTFYNAQTFESLRIALENMPHGQEGVLRKAVIEVTTPHILNQAQTCGDILLLMPLADSMSPELASRVVCKGRDLLRQPLRGDAQQGIIREATVNIRDEAKLLLLMLYNTLAHIANRGDDALTHLANRGDNALASFIQRGDDLLSNAGNEIKFASRGVIGILYGTSACLIGGGAYISIGALRMLQKIILTMFGKDGQNSEHKETLKKIAKQLEHLQEQIDKKATIVIASQSSQKQLEAKNTEPTTKATTPTVIEKDTKQNNAVSSTDEPKTVTQENKAGALTTRWMNTLGTLRRWPAQKATGLLNK